jgi:hypothetical protein
MPGATGAATVVPPRSNAVACGRARTTPAPACRSSSCGSSTARRVAVVLGAHVAGIRFAILSRKDKQVATRLIVES